MGGCQCHRPPARRRSDSRCPSGVGRAELRTPATPLHARASLDAERRLGADRSSTLRAARVGSRYLLPLRRRLAGWGVDAGGLERGPAGQQRLAQRIGGFRRVGGHVADLCRVVATRRTPQKAAGLIRAGWHSASGLRGPKVRAALQQSPPSGVPRSRVVIQKAQPARARSPSLRWPFRLPFREWPSRHQLVKVLE